MQQIPLLAMTTCNDHGYLHWFKGFLAIFGLYDWGPHKIRVLTRWIYPIIIFILLLGPTIFAILDYSNTGEELFLSYLFFSLIIPIEYFLGWRYFRKNHFYATVCDCRKDREKNKPTGIILMVIILILTTIMIVIDQTLVDMPNQPRHFGFFTHGQWAKPYLVFYCFFGCGSLVINMVTFSYVLSKHIQDLKKLHHFMANDLVWRMDNYAMNDLARWIVNLRSTISASVENMESFYTWATILGAVALGPIIEFQRLDAYLIYYISLYCIMQALFMSFIYLLSDNRQELYKLVKSPMIMSRYLARMKDLPDLETIRNLDVELGHETINRCKIAAHSRYDEERREETEEVNLEHMALRLEYKTMAGIDWLVLQKILSEQWADFDLLGISFGGTGAIKKGIGMTSLIILAANYLNSVTFAHDLSL